MFKELFKALCFLYNMSMKMTRSFLIEGLLLPYALYADRKQYNECGSQKLVKLEFLFQAMPPTTCCSLKEQKRGSSTVLEKMMKLAAYLLLFILKAISTIRRN